jgi:hypothetical protein
MNNNPVQYGFPVQSSGDVPAIGSTGFAEQLCPLIKGACVKSKCMFWVELFLGKDEAQKVGHCAYYWNALQLVVIKDILIRAMDSPQNNISRGKDKGE